MNKPQNIKQALRQISDANEGLLRPVDVVEAARDPRSPLHSKFEWDDSEAAHLYRLEQARRLIRVTFTRIGPEEDEKPIRMFFSLAQDRHSEGGYRTSEQIMFSPKLREQLLEEAMEEMERFARRYGHIKELAEVCAAMRRVKQFQPM